MSSRTETWVAGIVGVAVGAALAVTIFLVSQPPATREQATGAIGAAERFRTEQIKEGDTGITGFTGSADQFSTTEVAQLLGRAAADRQAEALNKSALELRDSMWAHATALERMNEFLKADAQTQRAIVDRIDNKNEKAVFERALADRSAQDRSAHEALGRVPAEVWNKAALELKDSMWANATALERMNEFLRADAQTQRAIVDRIDSKSERAVFERVMADRSAQDRSAHEALGRVPDEVWNKAALELKDNAAWANATALDRINTFLKADAQTQRVIVDRIDNMNEKAVFERVLADRSAQDRSAHEALGRVPAEVWNKSALELKDSMWAHATALDRINTFLKVDAQTQRAIVDRIDSKSERAVFERALTDRSAQDRVAGEAFGRVPAEVWNKAALELKDSMWAHATALEKMAEFLRADAQTQRAIVNRMPETERFAFERVLADRAVHERAVDQRAAEQ